MLQLHLKYYLLLAKSPTLIASHSQQANALPPTSDPAAFDANALSNDAMFNEFFNAAMSEQMSGDMEQMMKAMGQEVPKQKKILELNPSHPLIETINDLFTKENESAAFGDYVGLIYDQALLTEGSQLKDPLGFARKVSDLMVKAGKA